MYCSDKGPQSIFLTVQLANQSLILTSLFAEYVDHRLERYAAPSIEYYEFIGSSHYRIAQHHPIAEEFDLTPIFTELANNFPSIRKILQEASNRFFCFEKTIDPSIIIKD